MTAPDGSGADGSGAPAAGTGARAVRFDAYGDVDVLYVADVPMPQPAAGEVVVEVRAAGLNPSEASIRKGLLFSATFPSGQGTDVAGVVTAVGDGVTDLAVGDEVVGWSSARNTHATHAAVPAAQLLPRPARVSFEAGGSLYVAGMAALAAVRALGDVDGRTVVVSAAAGGVGSTAVQLLRLRGARVIGLASPGNADWLRSVGVTPVAHGDGVADRIAAAAPSGVDALLDTFGGGYVDLAHELGVPAERIVTTIDFAAADAGRARTAGTADAGGLDGFAELLGLVAEGGVSVEIAASFGLDRVREAFELLERRRTRGKIVLVPSAD